MAFLTLLLIPLLVAGFFLLLGKGHKVTIKEFLLHMLAQMIVAGISVAAIYWSNVGDTEIWNGRIAQKVRERVSCSHSYRCNCYDSCSGTGKDRTCVEICQTCYDHAYDVDWYFRTTNGERINVARVNRQGTTEPPRWTVAKKGEPTAVPHYFENYVKGASNTLYKKKGLTKQYEGRLPAYPQIYDLHRSNRAVGKREWQPMLSNLNADLGATKQVNVILVETHEGSQEFGHALEQHWLGGKQNDVVAVVGTTSKTHEIKWVYVFGWAKNNIFNIKLRDDLLDLKTLDNPATASSALRHNVQRYYERKSMEDYAYLRAAVTPTTTQWLTAMIIGLLISIGLGIFFYKQDTFGDERYRRPRSFSRFNRFRRF